MMKERDSDAGGGGGRSSPEIQRGGLGEHERWKNFKQWLILVFARVSKPQNMSHEERE
ncbi:hypothetical protein QJS04_geneDACA020297 [Acorus gramineus]|uniref:Uncharacterized protein n=1 Tax=Acorus gramineus TaxID=55184 RepID=A0AAV9AAW3_ACOGR|nr:hypothetical protein QJS04_geneDACA020297 [Acorus gramineus]